MVFVIAQAWSRHLSIRVALHVSSSLWNSYPKEPQAARVKHLLHSSFTLKGALGDRGDPVEGFLAARATGIKATLSRVSRRPPTEVGIVGGVVFIGEELFILATLVLCRAHKDMR